MLGVLAMIQKLLGIKINAFWYIEQKNFLCLKSEARQLVQKCTSKSGGRTHVQPRIRLRLNSSKPVLFNTGRAYCKTASLHLGRFCQISFQNGRNTLWGGLFLAGNHHRNLFLFILPLLFHSSLVDYLAQVIYAKNCPTTFYCIFQLIWVPMTTMQNIRVCFLSSQKTLFS